MPLYLAVLANSTIVAQLLLQPNTDIEAMNEDHWTLLYIVVKNYIEVTQPLAQHNVDIKERFNTMEHLLSLLFATRTQKLLNCSINIMLTLKEKIKTMEHLLSLLLTTGVQKLQKCSFIVILTMTQEFKDTSIYLVANENSAEVAELLLQHNAEIPGQDEYN